MCTYSLFSLNVTQGMPEDSAKGEFILRTIEQQAIVQYFIEKLAISLSTKEQDIVEVSVNNFL